MNTVKQVVTAKKSALAQLVQVPLTRLANRCAEVWPDPDRVDALLLESIAEIPKCHLLYGWNADAIEMSSLVRPDGIEPAWRGRDLSQRPYLKKNWPYLGTVLSSVYVSDHTHEPCMTALQAVTRGDELLGFIAADFNEKDLPLDEQMACPEIAWQQYRGDPAVRGTLFLQQRAQSIADDHIDDITDLIDNLMRCHGVFHSKIHFSSGRCTVWHFDDPYRYQILGIEETMDPDTCLAYPLRSYPDLATMPPEQIRPVLKQFKALRFADENIYLRVGSINIIDGMLGLTFSCDGSHYMPVDEFLSRDIEFWLGPLQNLGGTVCENRFANSSLSG